MPKREPGLIIAAIIAAIGTIVAAVIAAVGKDEPPETPSREESNTAKPSDTPDEGHADGTDSEPEAPTPAQDPWLYPFVYSDGSGVTVCGDNFPNGDTVELSWEFYSESGKRLDRSRFEQETSEQVDDTGPHIKASGHLPPDVPDGTEYLKVHARSQPQDVETLTNENLVYDPDGGPDGHGKLAPPGEQEEQCPATWPPTGGA